MEISSRGESLLAETKEAVRKTGSWHEWLWQVRLGQAEAEIALTQNQFEQAIHATDRALEKSRAHHRRKYEILNLWTRARALAALGRQHEAISALQTALQLARPMEDPNLLVKVLSVLLPLDGSPELAQEAGLILQRVLAAMPDEPTRRRFESAEPVQILKKMASLPSLS